MSPDQGLYGAHFFRAHVIRRVKILFLAAPTVDFSISLSFLSLLCRRNMYILWIYEFIYI